MNWFLINFEICKKNKYMQKYLGNALALALECTAALSNKNHVFKTITPVSLYMVSHMAVPAHETTLVQVSHFI